MASHPSSPMFNDINMVYPETSLNETTGENIQEAPQSLTIGKD